MKEIFTIGYVSFTPEEMAHVLQKHGITCVVDVRSDPHSSYYTQYNRENISAFLNRRGILYRNYAASFGARQDDLAYYPEGYLDFSLFTRSDRFREGVKKIESGMAMGYRFALMCAEKDPMTCHRAIMIGRALKEEGFSVRHLIDQEKIETQEEMEQRGIGNQLSLFPEEQLIDDFYRKQNRKIGYRLDSEMEGIA